jgi:hypothetical protein
MHKDNSPNRVALLGTHVVVPKIAQQENAK